MNWDRILQNDVGDAEPLRQRIDSLFAEQRTAWPALADGENSLRHLQTKTLDDDGERIIVQVNPARRRSTHAKTDAGSIAARPCFLCPKNMPAEERGVAFENFVVLPNPFPILPLHCTIAAREHGPQQLAGRIGSLLRLAAAIGPDLAAMYNGPRCGASAPDHLHFQAAGAERIPILARLSSLPKGRRLAHTSFGRPMLIFTGASAAEVQSDIEQAVESLRRIAGERDEPMLNVLIHQSADRFVAVLFPRRAHRPACYFATGEEHLAVSPAVLEMAGLLVTTEPEHFERLDATTARRIYEQVSLEPARFDELAAQLK